MAHIPIKLYNTRPSQIVLIDSEKTLQQSINEGYLTTPYLYGHEFGGAGGAFDWTVIPTVNTSTTPATMKVQANTSTHLYNSAMFISISMANIKHIKTCKTHIVGSSSFYHEQGGIMSGAVMGRLYNSSSSSYIGTFFQYNNVEYGTAYQSFDTTIDGLWNVLECMSPNSGNKRYGWQEDYITLSISKLELIDIEY